MTKVIWLSVALVLFASSQGLAFKRSQHLPPSILKHNVYNRHGGGDFCVIKMWKIKQGGRWGRGMTSYVGHFKFPRDATITKEITVWDRAPCWPCRAWDFPLPEIKVTVLRTLPDCTVETSLGTVRPGRQIVRKMHKTTYNSFFVKIQNVSNP